MEPNLDCREDAKLIGQNFQPESPLSWLLCVLIRCHDELDPGCRSWDDENSKPRRLWGDNCWNTNQRNLYEISRGIMATGQYNGATISYRHSKSGKPLNIS